MNVRHPLAILVLIGVVAGCDRATPPEPQSEPSLPPATVSWQKPIVCQPQLNWGDGETTHQGTGFFVRARNGRIAAVSSSHFLNFDGAPLLSSQWLNVRTGDVMADMDTAWKAPRRDPFETTLLDDYWIMPVDEANAKKIGSEYEVLEFDDRPQPAEGEAIWFPNKDDSAELGYVRVAGIVTGVKPDELEVQLADQITLQSQSGSPIVSGVTNRVVGTLSGGTKWGGKDVLLVAPIARMRAALQNDTTSQPLKNVVGKPTDAKP